MNATTFDPPLDPPLAVRAYLFGEDGRGDDSLQAIVRSLRVRGPARAAVYGIEHLTGDALDTIDEELAGAVHRLLDQDVGALLVQGWQTHARMVAAARATLDRPEREEIVELATHRLTWTYQPKVDIYVDELRVNTLEFVFTVEFEIEALVAIVRHGCLTALRSGGCVIATTLTLEGVTVLPRREVPVEHLSMVLPLRRPIPLLPGAVR
jgi:hypothetical protein